MLSLTTKTKFRKTFSGKLVLQVEVESYGDSRLHFPKSFFVDAKPTDLYLLGDNREIVIIRRHIMGKFWAGVCVLFVLIVVGFICAGNRYYLAADFAKQQPALITSEGVFTCVGGFEGQTIFSKPACIGWEKTANLPEGAAPTVFLPKGITKISKE